MRTCVSPEQCINRRIKRENPFSLKPTWKWSAGEKSLGPCCTFYFHFVPSTGFGFQATTKLPRNKKKTVIYFTRLILNEWTIEQMAFWYLNFKSTTGNFPSKEDLIGFESLCVVRDEPLKDSKRGKDYLPEWLSSPRSMSQRHQQQIAWPFNYVLRKQDSALSISSIQSQL